MADAGSVVCSRLGFSIWLPAGWRAAEDDHDREESPAEAARTRFDLWYAGWWESLSDEQRDLVTWGKKVGQRGLAEVLEGKESGDLIPWEYKPAPGGILFVAEYADPEASRAIRAVMLLLLLEREEKDVAGAQSLGLIVGYFRAESAEKPGLPDVEISRYRFDRPLEAIDFYEAAKPSPSELLSGNRPSRIYKIDGMDAVRFYGLYGVGPVKVVSHYACARNEGWEVSGWSEPKFFENLKPTFLRMAESLSRVSR